MSKKIDSTLTELIKALKKHSEVAVDKHASMKRRQRATARVSLAATAYAAAVHAHSGLPNPFDEIVAPGLEEATIASLAAERDALATRPIATIDVTAEKAEPAEK